MRLKSVLANGDIEKMAEILKSDCDKFLKEIKGGNITGKNAFIKGDWILRGVDKLERIENGLIKKRSHLNKGPGTGFGRKPRMATWLVHHLTNLAGKEIFGWPIRDGVATMGRGNAHVGDIKVFGKMRIFLPIGDYEYVWSSNIRDFNDYNLEDMIHSIKSYPMKNAILLINSFYEGQEKEAQEELKDSLGVDYTYDEVYTEAKKMVKEYVMRNYIDKKLYGAMETGREVSFKCNEYYLVHDNHTFDEALKLGGWRK